MNRHPRAVTSPPITAVRRVDFLLQKAIVIGEMNRATAVERAPSHPVIENKKYIIFIYFLANYNVNNIYLEFLQ